jgi:hypothetical protein
MIYTSLDYAISKRSWEGIWCLAILAVGALLSLHAGRASAPRGESTGNSS